MWCLLFINPAVKTSFSPWKCCSPCSERQIRKGCTWVVAFFFFFGWLGSFFFSWVVKFQFKAILKSRAQQGTEAEAGGQVLGEQEQAAPSRGKHPAVEKLEEHPRSRDRQGASRRREPQQHPAAAQPPTIYQSRSKSDLQRAALPLCIRKSLAIHCFGLPFLLRKTLSGYEAI